MRYRANQIGARLSIEPVPKKGTTVVCQLIQAGSAEPDGPGRN